MIIGNKKIKLSCDRIGEIAGPVCVLGMMCLVLFVMGAATLMESTLTGWTFVLASCGVGIGMVIGAIAVIAVIGAITVYGTKLWYKIFPEHDWKPVFVVWPRKVTIGFYEDEHWGITRHRDCVMFQTLEKKRDVHFSGSINSYRLPGIVNEMEQTPRIPNPYAKTSDAS